MGRGARRMNSISRFQQITSVTSWTKATARDVLTFVHFTSDRSQTCKQIAKSLHALSKQPEYRRVSFVRLNVDKFSEVAKNANVMTVPSFQFYRNGVCLESFAGYNPTRVIAMLEAHLRSSSGEEAKSSPIRRLFGILLTTALAVGGFVLYQKQHQTKTTATVTVETEGEVDQSGIEGLGERQNAVGGSEQAAARKETVVDGDEEEEEEELEWEEEEE